MSVLLLLSRALIVAGAAGLVFFLYLRWCVNPLSQLFGAVICRGPARDGRIFLTFDDGPSPPITDQILDILEEYQVPAAFFVCGRNVERFPQTLRRIQQAGHFVGNHTFSHPLLWPLSRQRIAEEIDQTQEAVRKALGAAPVAFRPPYGVRSRALYAVLQDRGMQLITWSDIGFDWIKPSAEIAQEVLRHLRPGGIILLHDGLTGGTFWRKAFENLKERLGVGPRVPTLFFEAGSPNTVPALRTIIQEAHRAGLRFGSLHEFLSPAALQDGASRQAV